MKKVVCALVFMIISCGLEVADDNSSLQQELVPKYLYDNFNGTNGDDVMTIGRCLSSGVYYQCGCINGVLSFKSRVDTHPLVCVFPKNGNDVVWFPRVTTNITCGAGTINIYPLNGGGGYPCPSDDAHPSYIFVEEQFQSGSKLVVGCDCAERLDGGTARDWIYGFGGNDMIEGYGGNDLLFGGDGVDILVGDSGNDVFYGGPGMDLLGGSGGESGSDCFEDDTVADMHCGTGFNYETDEPENWEDCTPLWGTCPIPDP